MSQEDSDQPVQLDHLVKVLAVHMKKLLVLCYPKSGILKHYDQTARMYRLLSTDAQTEMSLLNMFVIYKSCFCLIVTQIQSNNN